jgi:hypothetical protein
MKAKKNRCLKNKHPQTVLAVYHTYTEKTTLFDFLNVMRRAFDDQEKELKRFKFCLNQKNKLFFKLKL